jgi:hypothetical protein
MIQTQKIIPEATELQNQAINKALEYIIKVTKKQGYLMPCTCLFGDGSRFRPLSYQGFQLIYNSIKETLQEKGYKI